MCCAKNIVSWKIRKLISDGSNPFDKCLVVKGRLLTDSRRGYGVLGSGASSPGSLPILNTKAFFICNMPNGVVYYAILRLTVHFPFYRGIGVRQKYLRLFRYIE